MSNTCPTCESPAPHLHPAIQCEGEVSPCRDPFHEIERGMNTPETIADLRAWFDRISPTAPPEEQV